MIGLQTNAGRSRAMQQYLAVLTVLFACAFGVWSAGRDGVSKLLAEYGAATSSPATTARGADFSPQDAAAHYAEAVELANVGEADWALSEFQRAAYLRPDDYFLWLELGIACDNAGDENAALASLQKAISLAPSYAQPRWQMGNLLLRRGETVEAFKHLREAVTSDPSMFPALIDLAWGFYEGDTGQVLQVVQPTTDSARILLARAFIGHAKVNEAMSLLRGVSSAKDERRRLVAALIESGKFHQASAVWLMDSPANDLARNGMFNGDFEGAIDVNENGFGWRITKAQTVSFMLEGEQSHSGSRSLSLDFHGEFDPTVPVISQLVPVEPRSRYTLKFAARRENLISGGLPAVTVREWGGKSNLIAESNPLGPGTGGWENFEFNFITGDGIQAVTINVQRLRCVSYPCPIFGHVWFDSFALTKL